MLSPPPTVTEGIRTACIDICCFSDMNPKAGLIGQIGVRRFVHLNLHAKRGVRGLYIPRDLVASVQHKGCSAFDVAVSSWHKKGSLQGRLLMLGHESKACIRTCYVAAVTKNYDSFASLQV